MAKDDSDDPRKPLLEKVKAKKSKSLKVSDRSRKIRKETAPAKSFDGIKPPTDDDLVDLQKYPRFEFSNTKVYFQDLIEGTGEAVLMEEKNKRKFNKQEVEYEYNRYNRSAGLVKSSDGRRLQYGFCQNRCKWLGRGLQGMKEGGIRRFVILPPQHGPSYKFFPAGSKPTPTNSEDPDPEIFDLKLLKVGMSMFCKFQDIFTGGQS